MILWYYFPHFFQELLEASNQHPVNYSPPVVIILCCQGITESLASEFIYENEKENITESILK